MANLARKAEKHVCLGQYFTRSVADPYRMETRSLNQVFYMLLVQPHNQLSFSSERKNNNNNKKKNLKKNWFKVARISYVHSNKSSNPQQPTRYKSNSNETISKQRTKLTNLIISLWEKNWGTALNFLHCRKKI